MASLLSAGLELFLVYIDPIWLPYVERNMFPDPIIPARQADDWEAINLLCCLDTGTDPKLINTRRVLNWLSKAEHYPGYINADGTRKKAANAGS